MKTQDEIIRLHDMLDEILLHPEGFPELSEDVLHLHFIIKRILCWTLNHPNGMYLQEVMSNLEDLFKIKGIIIIDSRKRPKNADNN